MNLIQKFNIQYLLLLAISFIALNCSEDTKNNEKSTEKKENKTEMSSYEHSTHDHSTHDNSKQETDSREDIKSEKKVENKEKATKSDDTDYVIKMKTNMGTIDLILYDETPLHKKNFLDIVNKKMYDGQIFHRVINQFMIQGGGIDMTDKAGNYKNRKQITAEFVKKYFHKKGALAAARMGDQVNPKRMSSWCQFYIVQGRVTPAEQFPANYPVERKKAYTTIGGTPHLDDQYTVFGEVLKGLDVVDKIAQVKTAPGDKPINDVIIESARAVKLSKADIKKQYNYTFM